MQWFILLFFSTGFAIKRKKPSLELIQSFHFISTKNKLILKFINNLLLITFSTIFLRYSIDFYILGKPQTSVTMRIFHMNQIYFSMILLSILMLIYLLIDERKILNKIKNFKGDSK